MERGLHKILIHPLFTYRQIQRAVGHLNNKTNTLNTSHLHIPMHNACKQRTVTEQT